MKNPTLTSLDKYTSDKKQEIYDLWRLGDQQGALEIANELWEVQPEDANLILAQLAHVAEEEALELYIEFQLLAHQEKWDEAVDLGKKIYDLDPKIGVQAWDMLPSEVRKHYLQHS